MFIPFLNIVRSFKEGITSPKVRHDSFRHARVSALIFGLALPYHYLIAPFPTIRLIWGFFFIFLLLAIAFYRSRPRYDIPLDGGKRVLPSQRLKTLKAWVKEEYSGGVSFKSFLKRHALPILEEAGRNRDAQGFLLVLHWLEIEGVDDEFIFKHAINAGAVHENEGFVDGLLLATESTIGGFSQYLVETLEGQPDELLRWAAFVRSIRRPQCDVYKPAAYLTKEAVSSLLEEGKSKDDILALVPKYPALNKILKSSCWTASFRG